MNEPVVGKITLINCNINKIFTKYVNRKATKKY